MTKLHTSVYLQRVVKVGMLSIFANVQQNSCQYQHLIKCFSFRLNSTTDPFSQHTSCKILQKGVNSTPQRPLTSCLRSPSERWCCDKSDHILQINLQSIMNMKLVHKKRMSEHQTRQPFPTPIAFIHVRKIGSQLRGKLSPRPAGATRVVQCMDCEETHTV